jgi:hypothetical protein
VKWELDLWYELWDRAGSQGLDTWHDMRHEPGSEGVPDVPPADGITGETPGSAPGTAAGG